MKIMLACLCTCCYAVSLTTFQLAKPPDHAMPLQQNQRFHSPLNLNIDPTLANDAAESAAREN
jgi:hypothetical protein